MIKFENKAIEILGDIGEGWFSDGITAKSIAEQVAGVEDAITLTVGSLGGDVSDALAIYAILRSHKSGVTGKIIGMTASSGTVVAMATDKGALSMDSTALFLIHNASTGMFGNAGAMDKTAETLRKIDKQLAGIYADRTGHTPEEMLNLMAEERWLTAQEALDWGFVDSIYKGVEAQNVINRQRAKNLEPIIKSKNKPLKINNMTDEEIKVIQDENTALKTKVQELEAKLAEYAQKEADAQAATEEVEIEAACEEKKMEAAVKANFKALAKKDFAGTLAAIKALPVAAVNANTLLNNGVVSEDDKKSLLAKYEAKKKAGKLVAWSVDNPTEYAAAVKIKFNRK